MLVALAVAAVIGASYPLIVLKLGFGPNISVVSAFFGYLALSALGFLTGRAGNRLENNLVQTAGTTAGQQGFMCVLLAAFDLLNARPELGFSIHLDEWQTFLWLTVAGLIGVLLAVPMRKHYIDDEKLPFPDGVAAGETLLVLEDGKKARSRSLALGAGMLASGLLTLLQQGPGKLAKLLTGLGRDGASVASMAVPEHLWLGATGKDLKVGLGFSLLSLGSGLLLSLRVALSMGLGLCISWILLPPLLVQWGAVKSATFPDVTRWIMWPATGMLVAGGLASLALKGRVVLRSFTALRSVELHGTATDFPIKWVGIGLVLLSAALCAIQYVSLGMPIWVTLLSLVLSVPLMLVGTRVLGETNWAPISAMANMMQALFALIVPGHVATNMVASGMSGTVAANGEHLMQDYKSGQIVGSSNRNLTILQLFAVPVGSAAVAWIYPVLRDRYGVVPRTLADGTVLQPELSSPISVKWAGFAELLGKGIDQLPPYAGTALLIGVIAGVLLAVLELKWAKWLPSPTGVGIGMLVPAVYVLPMVLGGVANALWKRQDPARATAFGTPFASGLIAGEALVAVSLALLAAALLALGYEV